jgi:hypothetical protein
MRQLASKNNVGINLRSKPRNNYPEYLQLLLPLSASITQAHRSHVDDIDHLATHESFVPAALNAPSLAIVKQAAAKSKKRFLSQMRLAWTAYMPHWLFISTVATLVFDSYSL